MERQILDTIIVGAGQSGLAMAYHLKRINRNFIIIDGDNEIGGSWKRRWDSLKLFTPTEFNHLPGMNFPCPKGHYPDKFEVAQYLKDYTKRFEFNIELNQMVFAIEKEEGIFRVECQEEAFYAREVIIATGPFQIPFIPNFSKEISRNVFQMHSKNYLNPKQFKEGSVCVVGGGDSGVQIANELAESGKQVYISCDQNNFNTLPQEFLGKTLWWWFEKTGLLSVKVTSRFGKWLSSKMQPIIGTDIKALFNKTNVVKVGRANKFENGAIVFSNHVARVENIVWATGYRPDFGILKFDNLINTDGYPKQQRGISTEEDLYFVGLPWMYTRGSATLGGVGKDAKYLADKMADKQWRYTNETSDTISKKIEELLAL